MNILVTGGCGFVGFNLIKFLKSKYKKNLSIDILDNLSRSGSERNLTILKNDNSFKNFFNIDCSSNLKLLNRINKTEYDVIFHFAAQVAVTSSIINPILDFNSNLLSTINILDYIRNLKKKPLLIYSSTNKVYGNLNYLHLREDKKRYISKPDSIDENFNLNFNTPYGCSKGASDQYITDFSKTYGFKSVVLRLSCIYGTFQNGIEDQGWINWIIKKSLNKRIINFYGNGKQVRDILNINDLCVLFDKLINKKSFIKSNTYNVGGSIKNSISLIELVDLLKSENLFSRYKVNKWRNDDQKYYVSNISSIKKDFGWSPKINTSDGIKEMIYWLKDQKNHKYLLN